MKSRALTVGLALVASVWLGVAHAELVTDRVGSVADLGFRECVPLTCVPGAPDDYYLRVGLQALPAGFTAANGDYREVSDISALGGLVGALNVAKLTLGAIDGATQIEEHVFDEWSEVEVRTEYSIGFQTASVTRDTSDNSVAAISLKGGFTWSGSKIFGIQRGGTVTFSDLRIDLDRQIVTADVRGQSLAFSTSPSESVDLNDIDLFTIGQIDGPSRFAPPGDPNRTFADSQNPSDYAATYAFSQLGLTAGGLDAITTALGLITTGKAAFSAMQQPGQIGSMSVKLAYGPVPVPEPSTWWMMGVGLAGLCVGARRRAAVAA